MVPIRLQGLVRLLRFETIKHKRPHSKTLEASLTGEPFAFDFKQLNLAVAKKRSKREMSVLEDLYSGTFSLLATLFPSILQKSPQVTSHVTHKTLKNPHWKGLEVHSSPFSMQR
jgi:hypothetical protein